MNLDYFKKIYKAIRDRLVLPMEGKNIEKRPDYSVYRLGRKYWVPLPKVECIANRH